MIHKLEADSILLEFGNRKILSDVYLVCKTGRITALLGRNGEGKSCLMNIIYGSLSVQDKSIRLDGTHFPKGYSRPDVLLYLPQFNIVPAFLSIKRVFKDFELSLESFINRFPEFREREKEMVSSLSGEEKRIIELYLIVAADSMFALLDEPFTHLNPLQIEKVKELLIEAKLKKGLIITDHMFRHVLDISDDLYLLRDTKLHKLKNEWEIEELGYARL